MRRIVVSEFVTHDGVAEEPGKWSFPFWNEEINKLKFDELFSSDAPLLGRVTYQGFAAAWPSMTDEAGYAKRMNSFQACCIKNAGEARVEQFTSDQRGC